MPADPIDLNLNCMTTVTLTAYGVRLLRHAVRRGALEMDTTLVQPVAGETPWLDDAHTLPAWTAPLTVRMELWRIAAIFGPGMRTAAPAPFVDNRLGVTPISGLDAPASTSC